MSIGSTGLNTGKHPPPPGGGGVISRWDLRGKIRIEEEKKGKNVNQKEVERKEKIGSKRVK
jgi:hypothetical protein